MCDLIKNTQRDEEKTEERKKNTRPTRAFCVRTSSPSRALNKFVRVRARARVYVLRVHFKRRGIIAGLRRCDGCVQRE